MMNRPISTILAFAATAFAAAGCAIDKTEVPALSGPSELSLSLALSAQPSTLTQDGVSQSVISIQARDANGQPARNIGMRAEILLGGAVFDFGRLSTKAPVTDQSGHATVMYTAPPRSAEPVDTFTVVTILVTPEAGDNRGALARQIDIRLVPPGVVLPPNGAPLPSFNFSPTNPVTFETVHFVSTSTDDGQIVAWVWNFGDGGTATGSEVSHEFEVSGSYNVVLTVTDDRSQTVSSAPVPVSVTQNTGPIADFTFSPTSPVEGDKVFFNASASTASEGHEIVGYKWNLGTSNGTASGVTVSKVYSTAGSYTITLTVTDDAGQTNTSSQTLTVFTSAPTPGPQASFVFSPLQPTVNATVFFNASASTSSPDAPIVSYEWDFGDNGNGSGKTPSHKFTTEGTFTVTLTVKDSLGQTDSTSSIVAVRALSADFSFSPAAPTTADLVTFTATISNATGSVSYNWDFGDPPSGPNNTATGQSASHQFATAGGGTYTVTLTVTDGVSSVIVQKQVQVAP